MHPHRSWTCMRQPNLAKARIGIGAWQTFYKPLVCVHPIHTSQARDYTYNACFLPPPNTVCVHAFHAPARARQTQHSQTEKNTCAQTNAQYLFVAVSNTKYSKASPMEKFLLWCTWRETLPREIGCRVGQAISRVSVVQAAGEIVSRTPTDPTLTWAWPASTWIWFLCLNNKTVLYLNTTRDHLFCTPPTGRFWPFVCGVALVWRQLRSVVQETQIPICVQSDQFRLGACLCNSLIPHATYTLSMTVH